MNFNDLLKKIKEVKIQGAENIAKEGVKAMSMKGFDKNKLLKIRPTEPALKNALIYAKKNGVEQTLKHFEDSKKKINSYGSKKVKKIVFTHCHSGTVINVLREARKKGKGFEVINTETRPLFQGRKTAKDLKKLGINVTTIVDSAAGMSLYKNNPFIKKTVMMIGADAILKDGSVINKIGSGMLAELAYNHKIPVYVITNSWKYSSKKVKIEERNYQEVWKKMPKGIKVKNLAFGKVEAKHITGIISELGILKPKKFVKKVTKTYPWIK